MAFPITTRALAVVPGTAEVTPFLDSANNNALTIKFSDCTYRVIDGTITQLESPTALTDALDKQLDHLTCAASKGIVSMADLTAYMQSYNLYFTSSLDASGNLVQSITSTAPAVAPAAADFTISSYSQGLNGSVIMSSTALTAGTFALGLSIDRDGVAADVALSVSGAPAGISIDLNSYISNSLGANVAYNNLVKAGTSLASGNIVYDATIAIGSYTFVIVLTAGSVTKYLPVILTVS
jgi:hypothetical protein